MTYVRDPYWMERDSPSIVTGSVDFWVKLGSERKQPFGFGLHELSKPPERTLVEKKKRRKKRGSS